jgi:hypothetical protein
VETAKKKWLRLRAYLIARLQEASTMRALCYVFAGAFAMKNPERIDAIVIVLMFVVGLIGAAMPDQVKPSEDQTKSGTRQ